MNLKKIIGFLVIALVVFFVITQPSAAAGAINNIGQMLTNAANSVVSFFTQLVS